MSLHDLAGLYGIQTAYHGIHGQRKEASSDSLLAALRCLGASVGSSRDVPAASRERRLALWKRIVEPVIVAWDQEPTETLLRLPTGRCRGLLRFRIDLENGESRKGTRRLGSLPTVRRAQTAGREFEAKRWMLPGGIPWGYHRLVVETPAGHVAATLLCAPREAYTPEDHASGGWGAFVPLYALRTERSWGAGDFSDLEALGDWTAGMGGKVIATLPFLAQFLDEPFEPSPYSPASRLFWNELYVDPTRSPEWRTCLEARRLFESRPFQTDIESMRSSREVDYRRLYTRKRLVLEALAESLFRSAGGRRRELERYLASHPLLVDYARFRATMERRGEPWTLWPGRLRDGDLKPDDYRGRQERYHLYAQWLVHEHIDTLAGKARGSGRGLYLDLPLGVHPLGFDVWREQRLFAREASVGAPPDPVFTGGQDWSFPPLHPERSREQGHRYFAACIRHQLGSAGLLRIDHVMGLHRMFWIPKGFDFKDGVYVRYPAEELYAILTLESLRHRSIIVGENLGIVPRYVNRAMARHNIQQMYLMQYALRPDPKHPMRPIPSGSVASLNTHDTPLFSAFWQETDIEDRIDLGLLDHGGAQRERKERRSCKKALLTYLKNRQLLPHREIDESELSSIVAACWYRLRRSRAGLVLLNLEDLWLETVPQNTPGSGGRRSNWRRKLRYTLEEFSRRERVIGILRRLAKTTPRLGPRARTKS